MYANVGYKSIASINGISVPFSSANVVVATEYNINQPVQPIGPVEYTHGPITIQGDLTIPVFTDGYSRIGELKKLFLSLQFYTIILYYGYDEPVQSDIYPRTVKYTSCVFTSANVTCQPGQHVTCTLHFIGNYATDGQYDSLTGAADIFMNNVWAIPFHATKVISNKFPNIEYKNVSGWSIEMTREWKPYYAWDNNLISFGKRTWSAMRPGNPMVTGSFVLINSQMIGYGFDGIPNGGSLFFDIGTQYQWDNYIEVNKALITQAPTPITGPNNRIVQNVNFIAVSNSNLASGTIDGQYNGLIN